jgi:DNA-binding GntR family transcriptional regulator
MIAGRGAPVVGSDDRPAVVDVLREAIRQGILQPGQSLVQQTLGDALGVSRIPIREALQTLAAEGLVVWSGDGARVTTLSYDEIEELYSLRAIIEAALAPWIVERCSVEQLTALEALVADMDTCVGPEKDPDRRWTDLNFSFHETLYKISRRQHHARMGTQLLTLIEPYSRISVYYLDNLAPSQDQHHEMVSAISRRDAASLEAVMLRHVHESWDDLLQYARDSSSAPSPSLGAAEVAKQLGRRLGEPGQA